MSLMVQFPEYKDLIQHIAMAHPEWSVSIYKELRLCDENEKSSEEYISDYVPHILIRSENSSWRAWFVPPLAKSIDDYILPEYQNVVHIHSPIQYSRPIDELLETDEGMREIIRSSNHDIMVKISNGPILLSKPTDLISVLEKMPVFSNIDMLRERIKEIDADLTDLSALFKEFGKLRNWRKHCLQLLLITVDCIGKIVCTTQDITQIPAMNDEKGNPISNNTFKKGLPKPYRECKSGYIDMRNSLIHSSIWYETAEIPPDDIEKLENFLDSVKAYWEEIKKQHRYESKGTAFNA